jgi:hypothetical protein
MVHALAIAVVLIWNGGVIGVGVVVLLGVVAVTWTWLEGIVSKSRMLRRLRVAASQHVSSDGDRARPKIDAWLLVNGSLGVGIHKARQRLYLFKGKDRPVEFGIKELQRVTVRQRRGMFGRLENILFLSDTYAGSGLELKVSEGDAQGFLRLLEVRERSAEAGSGSAD